MAMRKFRPMQHESFPRRGVFNSLAPLSFSSSYNWPATTLDTLSREGLKWDDYTRLVEQAGQDLGVEGLRISCRRNTWAVVLDIQSARNFRSVETASAYVESVFNRLERALSKRLQAHIDNPYHAVVFPQSVAFSSTALLPRRRAGPVMV